MDGPLMPATDTKPLAPHPLGRVECRPEAAYLSRELERKLAEAGAGHQSERQRQLALAACNLHFLARRFSIASHLISFDFFS